MKMPLSIIITFLLLIISPLAQSRHSFNQSDLLGPPVPLVPVATRAYETLEGFFNFYWKGDPLDTKIKFMFVCGQVGGWGKPHVESQCSCNNPKSCVNCYRWYDAVGLEAVATYGIYMNTMNHSEIAEVIYDHSPYNGDWNATAYCTFIDDFTWYGIAYLRVYEWLKVMDIDRYFLFT